MDKYLKKKHVIVYTILGVLILGLVIWSTYSGFKNDYTELESEYSTLVKESQVLNSIDDLDTLNTKYKAYKEHLIAYKVSLKETQERKYYTMLYGNETKGLITKAQKLTETSDDAYIANGVRIIKSSAIQSIQNSFKTFYAVVKTLVTDEELQSLVTDIIPNNMQKSFK